MVGSAVVFGGATSPVPTSGSPVNLGLPLPRAALEPIGTHTNCFAPLLFGFGGYPNSPCLKVVFGILQVVVVGILSWGRVLLNI